MSIQIRAAVPADAPALLAIYAPYVEQTAITFEYDVPAEAEFTRRIADTLQNYPYLMAEQDGVPVGTPTPENSTNVPPMTGLWKRLSMWNSTGNGRVLADCSTMHWNRNYSGGISST